MFVVGMKGTFAVGTLGGWPPLEVSHPWSLATLGGRVPCCRWVTLVVVAVMKFVVRRMATAFVVRRMAMAFEVRRMATVFEVCRMATAF